MNDDAIAVTVDDEIEVTDDSPGDEITIQPPEGMTRVEEPPEKVSPWINRGRKVPLILFSGGLDSTFLVWQRLLEGDVDVLYIGAEQGADKRLAEFEARIKLLATLSAYVTSGRIRNNYRVEFNVSGSVSGICNHVSNVNPNAKFQQAPAWIYGALQVINSDIHSCIEIAYVSGDSICPNLHDIKAAWDALCAFGLNHPVPINFPTKYISKEVIMDFIPMPLYKDIWVCEMTVKEEVLGPDDGFGNREFVSNRYSACGSCTPCKTHKAAIFKWGLNTFNQMNYTDFDSMVRDKLWVFDELLDQDDRVRLFRSVDFNFRMSKAG